MEELIKRISELENRLTALENERENDKKSKKNKMIIFGAIYTVLLIIFVIILLKLLGQYQMILG